uniref:LAGLIDADG homing endonuclease n=1 Tax=Haematococcus lacustris TaxID=44745 RepID=Q8SMI8_HAELA|nr:LAGLIDADG homing endonuclease [Haematococcus lacustris]YP_009463670.1 LAGLIDADG homing endonuclease [Haematococcus lacustris]AAL77525.1 unknown [Haematococcus lacustris]ALO21603.1 putative LAGLIDADG homing endonuclease [Haematococcus lacustris]AUW36423.1 LAGLIDADG homing endonuclease [Haematococcus lacustris]AUW36492.1 LAGLIDADG homing endonuclease [Haematococcus lacustris]
MQLTDKWVVGFVDGDGCFKIINAKTGKRYCFVVSQDKRSVNVLYALKKKFGCGSVNKVGKNMREYRVSSKKDLIEIILPFFEKNPLQTEKLKDFQILYEDLTDKKLLLPGKTICRDWLTGFIDAEANFHVSMVKNYPRPQFVIGLHLKEKEILESIQNWMRSFTNSNYSGGTVYEKKKKNGSNYLVYQISSLTGFLEIIKVCTTNTNRCLLKTSKRIDFLKFKQIIRIIQQKRHLTDNGILIIKKIQQKLVV